MRHFLTVTFVSTSLLLGPMSCVDERELVLPVFSDDGNSEGFGDHFTTLDTGKTETMDWECHTTEDCMAESSTLGPCKVALCDSLLHICVTGNKKELTPCDDADDCTHTDLCNDGECLGSAVECSDDNQCTEDKCQPQAGCLHEPLSNVICNDENVCTQGDMCVAGTCEPGEYICVRCGDGTCEYLEDCAACPEDCGPCPFCGDDDCNENEDCKDCPDDCGQCPPECGDGALQTETGEQCDDGNNAGDDGCDENCKIEPQTVAPGTLIITEIMKDPMKVSDAVGEWFEVHNSGDVDADINGWLLTDEGIDEHTIFSYDGVVIPAGGYLVLGVEAKEGLNGGVDVGYQYADYNLANGEDEIILSVNGVTVDAVSYDNGQLFPDEKGEAISLSYSLYDSAANDEGTAWCSATLPFGDGDLGTPGASNPPCPPCGDGECNGKDNCQSCPEDCGECCGNGGCELELDEDCVSCPDDCGECCGNNGCEPELDEDCVSCPEDCGGCCGNGGCEPGLDEDCVSCPEDCDDCEGSCCIPSDSIGCSDPQAQNCVCNLDPFCCQTQWDSLCAAEADDCGSCTGDCCTDNGSAGCDDQALEECVCAADAFCCDVTWDDICASNVEKFNCGLCCGNGECHDDETCVTCPEDCAICPPCGDDKCNGVEDCVSCEGDCGPCEGGCCADNGSIGCDALSCQDLVCAQDNFCCANTWDGICAGQAEELCVGCMDVGDCCGTDHEAGCENQQVEDCVCALDPWCCNNNWDGLCVGESEEDCGANCELAMWCGDEECNEDEDCETCAQDCAGCCGNSVCEADVDENCVSCDVDCGVCHGNCCASNDSPGCDALSCQGLVCAQDDFCCTNKWDILCAMQAEDLCVGCMDVGDCCGSGHGAGCENQQVEDCVCALDAYCCDNKWDSQCVSESEEDCGANCELAMWCGDKECNENEDCDTCAEDCPGCCGNDLCETAVGEDCVACKADCGACPPTCADRCDDGFNGGFPCQCEEFCFAVGDCCTDVCAECEASLPGDCALYSDTCQYRCGEFDAKKACQCDSVCFDANDCCEDVCAHCDADYPEMCP